MPTLHLQQDGHETATHPLYKRITSIGRGIDNDIVIEDDGPDEIFAHVAMDVGRGVGQGAANAEFHVTCIAHSGELEVNGRARRKHKLKDGDRLKIGKTELVFSSVDSPANEDERATTGRIAGADHCSALFRFSERLLANYDLPTLLESLMDAVVGITSADKGFLLLADGSEFTVRVARNLHGENVTDAIEQLSDSIVAKVIRTGRPVIVSDATRDAEFQNAMSVMSLHLSSAMCVPLMERGNLLGAIYVGSSQAIRLFDDTHLELLTIFAAQASLLVRNALLVNELKLESRDLQTRLEAMRFGDLIGACPAMQDIYKKVQKIATTDISVLITGETGTGKEPIARELHRRSGRAERPFITINCGAIPENLLESELFGHVRGAFTGAVQNRPGKFHAADGGSLFLDEMGEMPLQLQVKLLRVLQDRHVVRVGESRPEPVDIRVIAATNRNLAEDVRTGRFREDLYYRLNVVQIHLPPLRERGDDVVLLAKYLLAKAVVELKSPVKGFAPSGLVALRKFHWPGNIRQLENHLKKAVVLADKALLDATDLGLTQENLPLILPLAEAKERFQRDYINQILELNGGNRTKTARDLGVDPRTIFRHLEKDADSDSVDAADNGNLAR